jgi:hypothetical protein
MVHNVITGARKINSDPLESAKQQAHWNRVKSLDIEWPEDWFDSVER